MHPLVNIGVRAARAAGKIIAQAYERADELDISLKGRNNFVTQIDKQSEQEIIQNIRQAYPDHAILGEESGSFNGNSIDEITWIIDPLDGTTNFIHGYPQFAVSIGIMQKNRIEHAVVYDPTRDELFTASRGRGAQMNSKRLRVAKQPSLEGALVSFSVSARSHHLAQNMLTLLNQHESVVSGMRHSGSAAIDLSYVAAGRLDGCWQVDLEQWDLAAGSLLITEAGGLISDFEGGNQILEKGEIVAGNPKIFKSLLQVGANLKNR
jgi:myo-inositol-1(or 4)-monophosphatase